MKHLLSGATALVMLAASMTAQAELTGNVGWDSEYIFRGVPQADSSVNGGVDWEQSFGDTDFGYYVGTWAADVSDGADGDVSGGGLEIDYYGGLTLGLGDFDFLAGYTYYDYTDDFDDTYKEVNLEAGWKFISIAAALGEYENFDEDDLDYQYYELTLAHNGFFATVGSFHDDFDGEYYQAGYGTELWGIDVTASWIYSTSDLLDPDGDGDGSDQSLIVQVSKGFSWQQVTDAWKGIQKAATN